MKKKEIIELLSKYNDEDEFDLWIDEEDKIIVPTNELRNHAFDVYREVISAIADGYRCHWQDICEQIQYEDMLGIESLGYVSVIPVVHNDKLFYRIDKNDLKKNSKLYSGLFEPNDGYFVHQVCQWEDSYSGQMLFPFGGSGKMLCVGYHC